MSAHPDPVPRRSRLSPDWRTWLGPLLALGGGILDATMQNTALRLANPGEFHIAVVVIGTLVGGVVAGIATTAIGVVMLLASDSNRHTVSQLALQIGAMMCSVPVFGIVGRQLRHKTIRRLRRAAALHVLDHYRALLQDLSAVVWEFDIDEQRITAISDSTLKVLGRGAEAWIASQNLWREAQHPEDLDTVLNMHARLSAGLGDEVLEHRMIAADGRVVWVQTAAHASRDTDGHAMIRGVTLDVSAHKRAEGELQRALSLLTATLDATDNGILVVDLEGRISSFNRTFVEMWRLPEDVMRSGDDALAIAHSTEQLDAPELFVAKIRELYRDRQATSFDVLTFKDGRVFERFSQPQLIKGQAVGRVWSFRDASERVRAERALHASEEQLRQAQKMEAVGRLAGGIAHDFNNILTAVLGNLSLILDDDALSPAVRGRAEEIQLASERAANLTRQLLAFGRRQMLATRVEYMNVIVLEMLKLMRMSVGERIEIALDLTPEPCPVLVDRGQMEQVILNLVLNARDAMPKGGTIVIATRVLAADEAGAGGTRAPLSGRRVLLSVSDTGLGMDRATQLRIFEPFFTTKDRGRGTGLGLATAFGIVEQSGGSIDVRSAPGHGSTFDIVLPHSNQPPPRPGEVLGHRRPSTGVETVLVVEDEVQVRGLMCDALARAGYRVIEAPNGAAAIEAVAALQGALHLLVTDIGLPGMDGPELAELLLVQRPAARVLYVTGYAESDVVERRVRATGAALIRKPFTMEALLRRTREVLDA